MKQKETKITKAGFIISVSVVIVCLGSLLTRRIRERSRLYVLARD